MDRVVITKPIQGICHMQVCAVADATDDEILAACNRDNPSGTSNGWGCVHRHDSDQGQGPVTCADDATRLHILVSC